MESHKLALQSPPSRAAWIEIYIAVIGTPADDSRRLHGRRGLKFIVVDIVVWVVGSPPSRAAWIEITIFHHKILSFKVAAFTGGVD